MQCGRDVHAVQPWVVCAIPGHDCVLHLPAGVLCAGLWRILMLALCAWVVCTTVWLCSMPAVPIWVHHDFRWGGGMRPGS